MSKLAKVFGGGQPKMDDSALKKREADLAEADKKAKIEYNAKLNALRATSAGYRSLFGGAEEGVGDPASAELRKNLG